MDVTTLFGFKQRVTHKTVMVKTVNGQVDRKVINGSFNWLAAIFTWFYALVSPRYKTPGFLVTLLIPTAIFIVVGWLAMFILGSKLSLVVYLAGYAWFGFMMDTWFKVQLEKNGYTEAPTDGQL